MMLRRRHRATSTEAAPLDTSKYDGLKKADLQGLLKERDLPTSGKVDELAQRLAEDDAAQPAEVATEVAVTDEVAETVQPEVQTGEQPADDPALKPDGDEPEDEQDPAA